MCKKEKDRQTKKQSDTVRTSSLKFTVVKKRISSGSLSVRREQAGLLLT